MYISIKFNVWVHVILYVHIYTCVHVLHMCVYWFTYVLIWSCVSMSMNVNIHFSWLYGDISIHVCVFPCAWVHLCIQMFVRGLCVCVCICMCRQESVKKHNFLHMCVHMSLCLFVHHCACMNVIMYRYLCVHSFECVFAYTHVHFYIYDITWERQVDRQTERIGKREGREWRPRKIWIKGVQNNYLMVWDSPIWINFVADTLWVTEDWSLDTGLSISKPVLETKD